MLIDLSTGRKKRQVDWITAETLDILRDIKHGLDDCYALLAPIDPGSTLVMSTPRNERVKGHITRVGTRIVKGTIHLQLRTNPIQTITIDADHPIHIPALSTIYTHLTECIDLVSLILSDPVSNTAASLSAQLRILSQALSDSSSLLKGHSSELMPTRLAALASASGSTTPATLAVDKSRPTTASSIATAATSIASTLWTTQSCAPSHFSPPLPENMSFYLSLQDSSIVLWLRALEPANAPVHFGLKLGLAIGTFRRLEHDEMDVLFPYKPEGASDTSPGGQTPHNTQARAASTAPVSKAVASLSLNKHQLSPANIIATSGSRSERRVSTGSMTPSDTDGMTEVYVREKVRVESADPSLMSLYAKLGSLSHSLLQARMNLAVVLGEELHDQGIS